MYSVRVRPFSDSERERRGSRGGFSAARRFKCEVIRLETTLDGFGLSSEQSRYWRIDEDRSRVDNGIFSASWRIWIIALMTGSSSSSYPRAYTSGAAAVGETAGGAFVGGDGGGVNAPSTWRCRLTRFGLRGLISGGCAECFVDVDGVVAGVVEYWVIAEWVVGEK